MNILKIATVARTVTLNFFAILILASVLVPAVAMFTSEMFLVAKILLTMFFAGFTSLIVYGVVKLNALLYRPNMGV